MAQHASFGGAVNLHIIWCQLPAFLGHLGTLMLSNRLRISWPPQISADTWRNSIFFGDSRIWPNFDPSAEPGPLSARGRQLTTSLRAKLQETQSQLARLEAVEAGGHAGSQAAELRQRREVGNWVKVMMFEKILFDLLEILRFCNDFPGWFLMMFDIFLMIGDHEEQKHAAQSFGRNNFLSVPVFFFRHFKGVRTRSCWDGSASTSPVRSCLPLRRSWTALLMFNSWRRRL